MASIFPSGIKGLSDTKWSGVAGAAAKLVGIDFRSKPGIITAHQKLTKNSGTTVDEFTKVGIAVSDGSTLWFSSTSGKIWRELAGVWTLVYTLNPIVDYDQYAAFNAAFPELTPDQATIWKTFDTDPLINFNDGLILAPSGSDIPKPTSRNLNRTGSSSTTISASIDIPNKPNQIVVAFAGNYDTTGGDHSVTGITYDGNAMTAVASGTGSSGGFHIQRSIKRYMNPTPGSSFNVVATFASASVDRFIYVLVFEGVHQASPVVDTDSGFGDSSPSLGMLDLIGTADNQLLLMATYTPVAVHIMGAGQTELINSNADLTPATFSESISSKALRIGSAITLSAAEFASNTPYVLDNFDTDDNEPVLTEEVATVYFATSDVLWKIPVADLASWSGNLEVVGTFQNGNDTYHPMVIQNLQLFIGDGNVVAKVNELYQFIPQTELNVEKTETITTMIDFDIDLLIGTKDISKCRVIRWDTVSESWTAEDDIYDIEVYAFIRDDNFVYALVGDAGMLYFYNGEKLIPYTRIPGAWSPSNKAKINANAVGFLRNVPVFGLSGILGDATELGVYSLGSYSKDYPKTLSLDYPISAGLAATVEIGVVLTKGSDMWVSWKSGVSPTYGIDKLDWTAKYASAYLETMMLSPTKNRSNFKTIARVTAPYALLPASTAVALAYKKNYAGSFTTFASVVDAKGSKVKAEKSVPEIGNVQLRMGLTVNGNDAPELEDLQLDFVAETTQTA